MAREHVFRSAQQISSLIFTQLLERLGVQEARDRSEAARNLLVELKLELRSLYSSLAAITGNEVSSFPSNNDAFGGEQCRWTKA